MALPKKWAKVLVGILGILGMGLPRTPAKKKWAKVLAGILGILILLYGTMLVLGNIGAFRSNLSETQKDFQKVEIGTPETLSMAFDPKDTALNLSLLLAFKNPHSRVEMIRTTGGFFRVRG